jgi:hypothetical protein
MSQDEPEEGGPLRERVSRMLRTRPAVRGRRVRRTLRHIEPWSVLKLALLFHAALFAILCVASALLWTGARASGTLDNVEDFITSVGGFGNCEPIAGTEPEPSTTTSTVVDDTDVDQLDTGTVAEDDEATDVPDTREVDEIPDDDEDCGEGRRLVGGFEFEDGRIFMAFAFGGIVLVLAGTGATVVLVLLFNLMSDLTGGIQVTVIEEDTRPRRRPPTASESGSTGPKAPD